MTTMGIEPTIFRFEVGRLIHWATRPCAATCLYSMQYFIGAINVEVWGKIYLVIAGQSLYGPLGTKTMF